MNYSEIIRVDERFDSTFNVTAERTDYWKTFISNSQFESNLLKVITSLMSSEKNQRKSIWVQGTYGTGKSHSMSVAKHLLYDELSEINDYLPRIQDIQTREKLKSFRKNKKVFPVVLRGVYSIKDSADMMYVIQSEVTKALEEKGIEITTKSDIKLMIDLVRDPKMKSFWDSAIQGRLRAYVSTKEQIIEKLEQSKPDITLLKEIIEELKLSNLRSFTKNIDTWLKEVKIELDQQGIADYLMIYWDEFTNLLSIAERRSILNTIQDIAELSKVEKEDGQPLGIFVFLITHKNLEATETYKELKEDERRMAKDRFLQLHYDMQPYTTYHILSGALVKQNLDEWDRLVDINYKGNPYVMRTLESIVDNTTSNALEIKEKIISLYPFHPYTAYLSTFVSRTVGSAERSIFEFLNDSSKGFKKYIQKDVTEAAFLTPEYVWNFFQGIFEEDTSGQFDFINSKYKLHIDDISKKGIIYENVFKVALLLNVLFRVTETEDEFTENKLVKPKEDNIIAAFSGVYDPSEVQCCLNYLDEEQVIVKSPDGIFEVSVSTLPTSRVSAEVRKIYPQKEDVSKIVEEHNISCKMPLEQKLSANILARPCEVQCFWGGEKEITLKSRLLSRFKSEYAISIAVFLFRGETPELDALIGRTENTQRVLIDSLIDLSKQKDYENIVFVSVDAPLGNKRFKFYVENMARYAVADALKMGTEANDSKRNAEKWVKQWVQDDIIGAGTARLIFRGENFALSFDSISKQISNSIENRIFSQGLEKINGVNKNTVWKKQSAKATVESILSPIDRKELEEKKLTGTAGSLRSLLQDNSGMYVFDENLSLIEAANDKHPVVYLCKLVQNTIKAHQNSSFVDLGKTFEFLRSPQYGYYQNYVCMAAVALAFRPFVGKLYKSGNGQVVDQTVMRDIIVKMFEYWEDNNKKSDEYIVRFSTEEERELVTKLNDVFNLKTTGLMETKWSLRDLFEEKNKSPLWSLKYAVNEGKDFNDLIDKMFWFVKTADENIQQKDIKELLDKVKILRVELAEALIKIEDTNCIREFFNKCLQEIGENDADLNELENYLQQNLAEKKAFWEESDVRVNIYKWKASKAKSASNTEEPFDGEDKENAQTQSEAVKENEVRMGDNSHSQLDSNSSSSNGSSVQTGDSTNKNTSDVKGKIDNYSGNVVKLKQVLAKLADKYPQILADLEDWLND